MFLIKKGKKGIYTIFEGGGVSNHNWGEKDSSFEKEKKRRISL